MIHNCNQCAEPAVEGMCDLHWEETEQARNDYIARIEVLEAENIKMRALLENFRDAGDYTCTCEHVCAYCNKYTWKHAPDCPIIQVRTLLGGES